MQIESNIILTGMGATLAMDLWSVVRKRLLGTPTPNYALVGRWIAHMPRGRFLHAAIAKSPPIRSELAIGWTAHYFVGIAFAALLAIVAGTEWFGAPTITIAMLVGMVTVAAPFFVMQPGMGLGIADSRTANPRAARAQSLVTHAMFGLGLYATAEGIARFAH